MQEADEMMETRKSGDFLSHGMWLKSVVTEDVILCGVSALEYIGLFTGYLNERVIDVYARKKGIYQNINYNLVPDFHEIEYFTQNGLRCTTFTQTVNDMLHQIGETDDAALTEALATYYFAHDESFQGLCIFPENKAAFAKLASMAMVYY